MLIENRNVELHTNDDDSASNPLRALKSLRKLGQGDRDDRDHMSEKRAKIKEGKKISVHNWRRNSFFLEENEEVKIVLKLEF